MMGPDLVANIPGRMKVRFFKLLSIVAICSAFCKSQDLYVSMMRAPLLPQEASLLHNDVFRGFLLCGGGGRMS